jgi:hypothetical protein
LPGAFIAFDTNSGAREKMRLYQQEKQIAVPTEAGFNCF